MGGGVRGHPGAWLRSDALGPTHLWDDCGLGEAVAHPSQLDVLDAGDARGVFEGVLGLVDEPGVDGIHQAGADGFHGPTA